MAAAVAGLVTTAAGLSWIGVCALEAAVLLAASWLGAALLRRGSAAARHQLWTLGVVGALLLPLLSLALPARSSPSAARWSSPSESSTSPIIAAPTLDGAVRLTAAPATGAAPTWLALGWALGAAVVGFRVVRGHVAARRLARSATPDVAAPWAAALADAASSVGQRRPVELRRSAAIASPMTVGVLRPRVLLPAAADGWSAARVQAVLVHELAHVRRRDPLVQLAAQLGCALYWWNPLAWLAAARLRLEREHACDDRVLDAGIRPSSYAADLVAIARTMGPAALAPAGALGIVDRSSTEARLFRILDATTPRRPPGLRFRFAARGLALAGAVGLACTSPPPASPTVRAAVASTTPRGDRPAPASPDTVSVGAPSIRGAGMFVLPAFPSASDLAQVAAEVQRRLGHLEQCYGRRLAVQPALAGTVVIHWTIADTGKVADTCITADTVGDAAVSACVNDLVAEGGFPAPQGGPLDVSFPFVFAAPAAPAIR